MQQLAYRTQGVHSQPKPSTWAWNILWVMVTTPLCFCFSSVHPREKFQPLPTHLACKHKGCYLRVCTDLAGRLSEQLEVSGQGVEADGDWTSHRRALSHWWGAHQSWNLLALDEVQIKQEDRSNCQTELHNMSAGNVLWVLHDFGLSVLGRVGQGSGWPAPSSSKAPPVRNA